MNNEYIDVNYTNSTSDEKYYTIREISNELQVKEEDIIFWISKLNDFLKINSVGMFQLFTPTDFKNISQIKHLILDENKTINEIKEFLSQENNIVVIKQKTGRELEIVNIFNKILQMQSIEINDIKQTNKQILDYNQKITKMLTQFITQYTINNSNQEIMMNKIDELTKIQSDNTNKILDIKNSQNNLTDTLQKELSITIEDTVSKKLNENYKQYECKIDELEKKQTERLAKLSEDTRIKSEKREEEYKQNKKKSFWNILFKK